jgi:hypothetical protein
VRHGAEMLRYGVFQGVPNSFSNHVTDIENFSSPAALCRKISFRYVTATLGGLSAGPSRTGPAELNEMVQ